MPQPDIVALIYDLILESPCVLVVVFSEDSAWVHRPVETVRQADTVDPCPYLEGSYCVCYGDYRPIELVDPTEKDHKFLLSDELKEKIRGRITVG